MHLIHCKHFSYLHFIVFNSTYFRIGIVFSHQQLQATLINTIRYVYNLFSVQLDNQCPIIVWHQIFNYVLNSVPSW